MRHTARRFARLASAALALALLLAPSAGALAADAPAPSTERVGKGLVFRVTLDPAARSEPATGRLLVYLVQNGSNVPPHSQPIDGPFYFAPQPLFGIDVKDFKPGQTVEVGDDAVCFPCKPSELPEGVYRAQAALDIERTSGRWRREPGNIHSRVGEFSLIKGRAAGPVELKLDQLVTEQGPPGAKKAPIEYVEVRSALLSDFYGREVALRAGVLPPIGFDPSRKYPAVYEVPGFGSNHQVIARDGRLRMVNSLSPDQVDLQTVAFLITLDPESANGHTLFANSDNNGPRAEALIKELIPELEKRFPLIADPGARAIRGHSSGGWSAVWLALNYPEVFGACWAGAPDPLDFRAFQRTNIYEDAGFYTDASGKETPSTVSNGKVTGTVREENRYEEALGPDNTSGEQWDSWQAVFGPRGPRGNPAELFDPRSGAIDRKVAEAYRRYDIAEMIRRDPKKYGPIFQQRIRIIVGDEDDWNLNQACQMVKDELARLGYPLDGTAGPGEITVIRMTNHGTVLRTPQATERDRQIADFFRRNGFAQGAAKPAP